MIADWFRVLNKLDDWFSAVADLMVNTPVVVLFKNQFCVHVVAVHGGRVASVAGTGRLGRCWRG